MTPLEFNIAGVDQYLVVDNTANGMNPKDCMTIEAMCQLLDDGQDPTIFSLPFGDKWISPFVVWRLGFFGQTRRPEFQVTIEGDCEPTTVRSTRPVGQYELVHLAGSYDGSSVRLLVNGQIEGEVEKSGKVMGSSQKATVGARSSMALGGLFVGRLFEMRFWHIARPVTEIDFWKDKSLPLPAPPGLAGLWKVEPTVDSKRAEELSGDGFSSLEIALASFVMSYASAYQLVSTDILTGIAREQYAQQIHAIIIGKTMDGYVVLYEPSSSEILRGINADPQKIERGGFFLFDWSKYTLSDILQMVSGNSVKVCSRREEEGVVRILTPNNREDILPMAVNPRLWHANIPLPQIRIFANDSCDGVDSGWRGRGRISSPLVTLESGETIRAFSWLFADVWRGELSWDITRHGLADGLALNDVLRLNDFAGEPLVPPPKVVDVRTEQPLQPLEKIIAEFESLIAKEDVDEVRDVLPFLGRKEHWILLNPTAQHVWPEKMLGNKWRVDFVIRESDGTYTATEVESPKKRLYKTGQIVEPYAEWTHAEQQVRDYCNFIDKNRDYVEREEGLSGILRPQGLVIIGRREALTEVAKQKLSERNADNGRYQTITFDDLLDQARILVQRLMAIIAPKT